MMIRFGWDVWKLIINKCQHTTRQREDQVNWLLRAWCSPITLTAPITTAVTHPLLTSSPNRLTKFLPQTKLTIPKEPCFRSRSSTLRATNLRLNQQALANWIVWLDISPPPRLKIFHLKNITQLTKPPSAGLHFPPKTTIPTPVTLWPPNRTATIFSLKKKKGEVLNHTNLKSGKGDSPWTLIPWLAGGIRSPIGSNSCKGRLHSNLYLLTQINCNRRMTVKALWVEVAQKC